MSTVLETIISKIKAKNPAHAEKLLSNLNGLMTDKDYTRSANDFFTKYKAHLEKNNISLDFGIDCYLHMIDDMLEARTKFIRTGQYANTSFEEVEKSIYGNSEVMTYHMHGLVLAQFLWFDQYDRIKFFTDNLKKYSAAAKKYLELGGGHGLYLYEAIRVAPEIPHFDMVDISESSLNLAKGIVNDTRVNYFLKNIFDFSDKDTYDFITIGEVIEHLEDPLSMMKKIHRLLNPNGVCYITTPINAPMIDHIYLFNNEEEIRDLFRSAGFKVAEEKIVISEKISPEKARKFKAPVMYAAFLKK